MRRSFQLLTVLALATFATHARAQAGAKARAEALFEEAQALMKKGELTSACPKFAASQKLDPAVGTLLNLATCYERQGKNASAWASFHDAENAARRANQTERANFAQRRADALATKLAHVVIRVGAPNANLEVKLDGEVLDSSAWNDPLPIDPGDHLLEVSAPGKRAWSTTIQVGVEPTQVDVAVPVLADEAHENVPPPTPLAVVPEIAPPAPPPSSPLRPIGIAVGAAGLVGIGIGAGFGINAKSKNDEALTHCPETPQCNDQTGVDLTHDAQASATASTVAFIAGGVVLATGVVLFLVAPHPSRAVTARIAPILGPGVGGAAIGGTF